MTRHRTRQPLIDTSRLILLRPDSLTPDLLHRRWRFVSPISAQRRAPDGSIDAWVRADEPIMLHGRQAVVWTGGYDLAPRRRLIDTHNDGVRAMYAIEAGLAEGPLSKIWRGRGGLPQCGPAEREGWPHHYVRQWRDVWCGHTPDGRVMAVAQLSGELRYVASVNSNPVLTAGGEPRQFGNPTDAMIAAEYTAGFDFATVSARCAAATTE